MKSFDFISVNKFALDLFERFVFGFRQFEPDKYKTQRANDGVEPERSRRAELERLRTECREAAAAEKRPRKSTIEVHRSE
jgi:hypothetical protein